MKSGLPAWQLEHLVVDDGGRSLPLMKVRYLILAYSQRFLEQMRLYNAFSYLALGETLVISLNFEMALL